MELRKNITNSETIRGYEVRRFRDGKSSKTYLSEGSFLNREKYIKETDSSISDGFQLLKKSTSPTPPVTEPGHLFEKKEIEGSVIKTDEFTVECDLYLQEDKNYIVQMPKSYFPKEVKTGMAFSLSLKEVSGYRKPIIKPRVPSEEAKKLAKKKWKNC